LANKTARRHPRRHAHRHDSEVFYPYRKGLAIGPIAHFAAILPLQPELFCLCNRGLAKIWRNKGWLAGK
jgi:hypothetical protein